MEGIVGALGQLGVLAAEFIKADEARRQKILDEADQAWRRYKEGLASLPAALAANDKAADTAAEALGD